MTKDLLKGLNDHLKLEFRASHEYLAMSVWLAEHDLPGFATWMRKQSSDETLHAKRIIDHLVERDQKVVLPAIAAPKMSWKSAEELCVHVLKNEQDVTASINELYTMAEKAKDRPGVVMLQWFVTEQMEEEAAARAVLSRIRLAGNTGVGLLMVDQELAGGSVPGMPASPTDAARIVVGPPSPGARAGLRRGRLVTPHRWNPADGPLTEAALRAKLESLGYRVARYVYDPGPCFPITSTTWTRLTRSCRAVFVSWSAAI